MRGLGYTDSEASLLNGKAGYNAAATSTAQTLRWYMGVFF
jgi:hypothetical protein